MKKLLAIPLLFLSTGCTLQPAVKGVLTAEYSLPDHAFTTPLPLDQKFIAKTAGKYFFVGQIFFTKSCEGSTRSFAILKNGDQKQVIGSVGMATKAINCDVGLTLQVSGLEELKVGEFVTFNAYQDSGSSIPLAVRFCPSDQCSNATWGVSFPAY